MKKSFNIFFLIISVMSCDNIESTPKSTPMETYLFLSTYQNTIETLDENGCSRVVFIINLENLRGNVTYDSLLGHSIISHHIPGTIDSTLVGIICGHEFDTFDKDQILFSATVYEYSGLQSIGLAGVNYFSFDRVEFQKL